MRVGADSGGTFTDVVCDDGRITKVPSTPDDPGQPRSETGSRDDRRHAAPELLAHGTTVATNALLQRRLGRVALVTTEGFADVIEIARQDRPSLYDPWADRPAPLVAAPDRLEVLRAPRRRRNGAGGSGLEGMPEPDRRVDAVAVALLHSDLDPGHERLRRRRSSGPGVGT